jgi:hypothetical protein
MLKPSLSTTTGSWDFDMNRSTNGQQPSSVLLNNNNNMNDNQRSMNKTNNEHTTKDASSRLATPTSTRHRNGNVFAAIDRLVHGPSQLILQGEQQQTNGSSNKGDMRSKSIDNLVRATDESTHLNEHRQLKTELFAWQNRMLKRWVRD